MPRALKVPDGTPKIAVRTRAPGTPLIGTIESSDLMLATLRPSPFSQQGWLFEPKYDGFRCLIRKAGATVELVSRPGKSLNASFPDMVAAVLEIPGDFVWDAELTVDKPNGASAFDRLQKRARTSIPMRVQAAAREHPARLYIFDMMAVGRRDLRGLRLLARKRILRASFDDTAQLVFVNGVVEVGEWVFDQMKAHDFEGMLAKRHDSLYQGGRTHEWQKVKNQGYSRQAALGWGKAKSGNGPP